MLLAREKHGALGRLQWIRGKKGHDAKFGAAAAPTDTTLGTPPSEPHTTALPLSMSCAAKFHSFPGAHLTTCYLLERCQHCLCGSPSTRMIRRTLGRTCSRSLSTYWASANTLQNAVLFSLAIGSKFRLIPIKSNDIQSLGTRIECPIR